jgi:hypothetical protein
MYRSDLDPCSVQLISEQAPSFVSKPRNAGSSESDEQVDWREGRVTGVVGLLAKDVEHDPGGKVELVEQKVLGMDDFEAEGLESVGGVVTNVRCDDGVGPSTDRCGHDMTIVDVWQCDGRLQGLPALDSGIFERFVHGDEPLADELGRDVRMDLDDGVGGLGEDPVGPERSVHLPLRDPQQRVGECNRYQDAGVEHRRVTGQLSLSDRLAGSTPPR